MKKSLLFTIVMLTCAALMAQYKPAKISRSLQTLYPETVATDNQTPLMQAGNPVVNTKAVMDEIIGTSGTYDMQSNYGPMQRVICWPDGKISASWMKGDDASFATRGTGYNYYDGSAWGAAPSARIETTKTGWPNLLKWNGNGELVVAHNSLTTLVLSTRATRGTGAWTQTLAPTGPIGSDGNPVKLLWPRAITNGNNNQNIHILTLTMPTGNGGIAYKGMDGCLIYYRSLDGGNTWDKNGIQLPGMDSTNFLAISADTYAWIEPHGDTIAFLVGSTWNGTFLMKSFDNGSTWTKQDIVVGYYSLTPSTTAVNPFYGSDGTLAGAMDKNGVFHIAFGRMFAYCDGTSKYWRAGTDGVVYWNSTMQPLDTAMMANIDSIYAHGLLIGYVAANQAGDSIVGFPYYKGALSNYPSVTIDADQNIYFLWSSLTVGNPDPTPYNYRHIWGRAWFAGMGWMAPMVDFNSDFLYIFQEFAYPEVAKTLNNQNLCMLTQTSSQPGSNVAAGTTYPAVPVHEVSFAYREIPTSLFPSGVGIPKPPALAGNYVGQNFPNPVNGLTSFTVNVEKTSHVMVNVLNIMGQTVMTYDKGMISGIQKITMDCSGLTAGIYFYTVKINNESFTHRMIVE